MKLNIIPFLWYAKEAEAAAKFYTSIFPDSKIDSVTTMAGDSPSGPEGSVKVVEFTLGGNRFTAMSAGPMDEFNHSISFMVECKDQAEVDRYWDALGEGGSYEPCGWLRDRYGVSWQITPAALNEMSRSKDRDAARRVTEAMLKMKKLDLAALERAFRGQKAA
jgi:predicted 3-demethylubiquinone-9 3-methyltransferase (glyoxalase superfamily)